MLQLNIIIIDKHKKLKTTVLANEFLCAFVAHISVQFIVQCENMTD